MLGADSTTGFLSTCAYMSSWKQANCSFFNPNIKQIIYPNIKFDKITKQCKGIKPIDSNMNTTEIYKSLNLFQEIHIRKSQSSCLTQKKWANLSGWEAKLKGRIITPTLSTQHRRLMNHKILLKNKERSKRKEKLQHWKASPVLNNNNNNNNKNRTNRQKGKKNNRSQAKHGKMLHWQNSNLIMDSIRKKKKQNCSPNRF